MNIEKDYYKILGVLQDAEDIVIKAAYKALAQKYHPDKYQGDAKHAEERMKEINKAYSILSDVNARKNYDGQRGKEEYEGDTTEDSEDLLHTLDKDWAEASEYFPDLIGSALRLSRYSSQLEFTFMVMVIEKRDFNNRLELEKILKESYLNKYFGTNNEIHKFAETLFSQNRRDVLQKLNRAVNLLGSDVAPNVIIDKIKIDFPEYKNNSTSPYVELDSKLNYADYIYAGILISILIIISMLITYYR